MPYVHSLLFHNKGIVYHLISLLLDSGKIQFTGTTFATILLVDMLVIKHGCCIDWYEWEPSTVHQLVFLHNKVIFWYFSSALVNSLGDPLAHKGISVHLTCETSQKRSTKWPSKSKRSIKLGKLIKKVNKTKD